MLNHKKYSVAQLSMLRRIINFAFKPENAPITNNLPALLAAFITLKGMVADVDVMIAEYSHVNTGIAKGKWLARITLSNTSYRIVKAVRAYAMANSNNVLGDQMKTSLSVLKKMGYENLLHKVNGGINTIGPLVSSLGDYGITGSLYNQWKTDRDALNDILTAPRLAISAHTVLGSNIESAMKEAMNFTKEQIDEIVATLMQTQPNYYLCYRLNRQISSPAVRHTTLKATVTNELGQPVINAIVTINELKKESETYKAVSGTTDLEGSARLSTFEGGIRTITIAGPGIIA
jgi:hypothetical protein